MNHAYLVGDQAARGGSLSRTMSEWQETCDQLDLPSESEHFCDYVLVFDEIVQDDLNEAKNNSGCCNCCQTSYKELEECLKVCRVQPKLSDA